MSEHPNSAFFHATLYDGLVKSRLYRHLEESGTQPSEKCPNALGIQQAECRMTKQSHQMENKFNRLELVRLLPPDQVRGRDDSFFDFLRDHLLCL